MEVNLSKVYEGVMKSTYRKIKLGDYKDIVIGDTTCKQCDVIIISQCNLGQLLKVLIKIVNNRLSVDIFNLKSRHYKRMIIGKNYTPNWVNFDKWLLLNESDLLENVSHARVVLKGFDIYEITINIK